GAHEDVGLAEHRAVVLAIHLRGAESHEERVPVALQLGPLMGEQGVLDGQLVETELALHGLEELRARLVEAEPHEAVRLPEGLAEGLDPDVADALALRVGHAVDDAGDGLWLHGGLSVPL